MCRNAVTENNQCMERSPICNSKGYLYLERKQSFEVLNVTKPGALWFFDQNRTDFSQYYVDEENAIKSCDCVDDNFGAFCQVSRSQLSIDCNSIGYKPSSLRNQTKNSEENCVCLKELFEINLSQGRYTEGATFEKNIDTKCAYKPDPVTEAQSQGGIPIWLIGILVGIVLIGLLVGWLYFKNRHTQLFYDDPAIFNQTKPACYQKRGKYVYPVENKDANKERYLGKPHHQPELQKLGLLNELYLTPDEIDVNPHKLLGSGQFGEVFAGELTYYDAATCKPIENKGKEPVACKLLKTKDDSMFKEFLSEVNVCNKVGQHKNVLGLKKVYCPPPTKPESLAGTLYGKYMLVIDFMNKGSIDSYLKKQKSLRVP